MSDYYQEHKTSRDGGHHGGGRGRGRGRHNDHDDHDNYGSQQYGQRPYQGNDDDDPRRPSYQSQSGGYAPPPGPPPVARDQRTYQGNDDDDYRRPQSYQSHGRDQGHGRGDYAPPPGPPPPSARGATGFTSQGGLDRGDFASDADIERMVTSGEFDERQSSGRQGYGYGYGGGGAESERRDAHGGRQDGRTQGQGYGARDNEYARYDAPSGPPSGRGYQSQQSGYGGESDRPSQYGPPQTRVQGRTQYDSPQGPPSGRSQGNVPAGAFSVSRDGDGSRYGGPTSDRDEPPRRGEAAGRYNQQTTNDRDEPPRRGEATRAGYYNQQTTNDRDEPPRRGESASYYNQQSASGRDDRYSHLAGMAQEHGDDDPELYRRATQGLHEKIQAQQSRPQGRGDENDGYKSQVDAHRKAYGGDDHGPMDADTIGAAAAMEAIKQTTASTRSSNAPAGGFQSGLAGSGPSSQPGRVAQEEEEYTDTAAKRAGSGGSGGMQDKLMALAMSHAGKLFDKKNAGSGSSGGDNSQDKAQAMQSAAATAMQLFSKYQTGKLESGDMTSAMTLAMKML